MTTPGHWADPASPRQHPLHPTVLGERWRFARQASCNGLFADVTVDLEPGPPGSGIQVIDGRPDLAPDTSPTCPTEFVTALFDGVRRALRDAPADRSAPGDLRVTLRAAIAHPVDSSQRGFALAGEMVVRQALARAGIELRAG